MRIAFYCLAVVLLYTVSQLAAEMAVAVGGTLQGTFPQAPAFDFSALGVVLLIEVPFALGTVALTLLFWRWVERRPWPELGFRRLSARELGLALLLGLGPVAVILPVVLLAGHHQIYGLVAPAPLALSRACLYLLLSVAVGFAEETPFRGYLLPALGGRLGRPWAVLLTALLFMGAHLADPEYRRPLNILDVTLIGIGLALLRLGTGSLLLPILTHAVYDLALFLLIGQPELPGVFRTHTAPYALLFGSERAAGLLDVTVAVLWVGAIWIWIYRPSLVHGQARVESSRVPRSR